MASCRFFLSVVLLALLTRPALADEIVITGSDADAVVTVGDFECTGCTTEAKLFSLKPGGTGGFPTTGELWRFFDRQNIASVEHLTICLDIAPGSAETQCGISKFQLKIESPDARGTFLTEAGLGSHSLVVLASEIKSDQPEAKLRIALGYDFMDRFSADSQERIVLDYALPGGADNVAEFSVQGGSGFAPATFNAPLLLGFITFWVIVFVMLSRVTRPAEASRPQTTPVPPSGAATPTAKQRAVPV